MHGIKARNQEDTLEVSLRLSPVQAFAARILYLLSNFFND